MNVLIVDDEKIITNSLKMILSEVEIFKNVVIATDGIEACRKVDNQKFALIIIDINMPKKDGLSVIKYIRENKVESEIILISGGFNPQNVQFANEYKIKHVLAKPFNSKKFVEKLQVVLIDMKKNNRLAA